MGTLRLARGGAHGAWYSPPRRSGGTAKEDTNVSLSYTVGSEVTSVGSLTGQNEMCLKNLSVVVHVLNRLSDTKVDVLMGKRREQQPQKTPEKHSEEKGSRQESRRRGYSLGQRLLGTCEGPETERPGESS